MEADAILVKAKERLRGHWMQGDYSDGSDVDTCDVCMLGAIFWTICGDPDGIPGAATAWHFVNRAISEAYDDAVRALEKVTDDNISSWNDTPGRTEEEVLAAFDKARELL